VSVVTDGDDAHGAHDVDGVGGDGTPWSMVDRRAAARHARAIGRSLPQRLVVVAWTRDARGVMVVARRRPNASAPCATAARSASVTLTSDGGALVLRSTPHALRAALAPLRTGRRPTGARSRA